MKLLSTRRGGGGSTWGKGEGREVGGTGEKKKDLYRYNTKRKEKEKMFVDISQGKITIIFFISLRSEIWDQDIHMQRKKIKERKIKQSILLTLKKTFLMFLMIEEQNV